MSVEVMSLVFDGGPRDTVQSFVMLAIADHADESGIAHPGVALLAEKTRQTERNVMRVLKALETEQWLEIRRRSRLTETERGWERKGNIYRLNVERLRNCAAVARAERQRRKGIRSQDTVSSDGFSTPFKSTLTKRSQDTVSGDGVQINAAAETVEKPVEMRWIDPRIDLPRGDMDGIGQATNPIGDMTNAHRRGDKSGLPILKNHHLEPSREPSENEPKEHPLPPEGGVIETIDGPACGPQATESWTKLKRALELDLGLGRGLPISVESRFRPIRAGVNDFELCFDAWWLERVLPTPHSWTFVTRAEDEAAAEVGLVKYQGRLEKLVRAYFPVPNGASVVLKIEWPPEAAAAALPGRIGSISAVADEEFP